MLNILIFITSIPVILILYGLIFGQDWSEDSKGIFYFFNVLILFIIGFAGWFLVGQNATDTTRKDPVNIPSNHITKTDYGVVVYDQKTIKYFNEKIDYDNIDSTTIFYYHVKYNMYGDIIYKELKYE